MTSRFAPHPGTVIELLGVRYSFVSHPGSARTTYSVEASRATVYQIVDDNGACYALKVFKHRFRLPTLIETTERLCSLRDLPGLAAAQRSIIIDPASDLAELQYALIIPWVTGTTWSDILIAARGGKLLTLAEAARLCDRFLEVIEGLQSLALAHTDISAANVILDQSRHSVQLVDLEDMFQPGAEPPSAPSRGSRGYQHWSGATCWHRDGDRYAAAVLAAEILLATQTEAAAAASDENLFGMRAAAGTTDARQEMLLHRLELLAASF